MMHDKLFVMMINGSWDKRNKIIELATASSTNIILKILPYRLLTILNNEF